MTMQADSEESIQGLTLQILARTPEKDQPILSHLLKNVEIFIRRIKGESLSAQEQAFPAHPLFSQMKQISGKHAAETLIRRLKLIDQFEVSDTQRVIDILTWEYPLTPGKALNARKARIIHRLYENPFQTKTALAKQLNLTHKKLNQELKDLYQNFAFRIFTALDPHKFKLAYYLIMFTTNTIQDTLRIETHYRRQPGFLRTLQLDRDYRRGILAYRFPDQPDGHHIFNQRIKWLEEEFFSEFFTMRILGHHYYLSFTSYDPTSNSFLLEADVVSQAMLQFTKENQTAIPSPQGFFYSTPICFDSVDYLLSLILFSSGTPEKIEYRKALLKRFGVNLSNKTIWARERELRRKNVARPFLDIHIPGLDEQVTLIIKCNQDTCEALRTLPSILPYAFMYSSDTGIALTFQRPAHCTSITGQLIRAIYKEPGVEQIFLLRYPWRVSPPSDVEIAARWNEKEQEWILQEDDI
jgi:hypothetical protein